MPSVFEFKIIQKQATPGPITTAIGTGNLATRLDFAITLPVPQSAPVAAPRQGPVPVRRER